MGIYRRVGLGAIKLCIGLACGNKPDRSTLPAQLWAPPFSAPDIKSRVLLEFVPGPTHPPPRPQQLQVILTSPASLLQFLGTSCAARPARCNRTALGGMASPDPEPVSSSPAAPAAMTPTTTVTPTMAVTPTWPAPLQPFVEAMPKEPETMYNDASEWISELVGPCLSFLETKHGMPAHRMQPRPIGKDSKSIQAPII